jgi:isoleucyl-tRNA synthetase
MANGTIDVPLFPGDHVTDDAGTGFVHTAPSHGDDDYEIGRKHGLEMTHNILDDGSFRADLPFFGGERIIRDNGKPGNANKAVIDKLVEVGKLLARKPHHDLGRAFLALQGAGDPPQPPAMVRRHRRGLGDGKDEHGTTIRSARSSRSTSW